MIQPRQSIGQVRAVDHEASHRLMGVAYSILVACDELPSRTVHRICCDDAEACVR